MKKSTFYLRIVQTAFILMMVSSFIVVKYPLLIFLITGIGLIGTEQQITYTKLKVIEDKIEEREALRTIRKQQIVVRFIQFAVLVTAILFASQTFHKIKL